MRASVIHRLKVNVNGINLFFLDTRTEGRTMLCLHGRWGRAETWSDLMLHFRDRYRIVAPDQRGHGLSDKPVSRYAAEDLALDVHGLIDHLGCSPVIAVGHSMGGEIAAYLAALYPQDVCALAVLDQPATGPETITKMPPEEISSDDGLTSDWPTPYPTYAAAVNDLRQRFDRGSAVNYFLQSLVETEDGYDFRFSRKAMAAIAAYSQDWHHMLIKIQCPVLLVRAAESWCLSEQEAEAMKPHIKHCTYFEVADSDHGVYMDNPDVFYPAFEDWLDSIEA